MIRIFLLLALFTTSFAVANQEHEFSGKHFVASYLNCDSEAICNIENLMQAMDQAVIACGATILNKSQHTFSPHGLTAVYLLSESHASIHTYPEFGACFVDLFTCGNNCHTQSFDQVLRTYLKPKEVNARFFERHEQVEETCYLYEENLK